MKSFNNFKSAFSWMDKIINKSTNEAISLIAKQEYEDIKEYIYIDTGKMYESGKNSDFDKGYVVIKAPQARWLYYTTWIKAGEGNLNAIPQWHELVKSENMENYVSIYTNKFNQIKKG